MTRHLVPGGEHDAVSVAPRDAPLFVVVLVVGGVVVPPSAVRLEDRSLAQEREVVAIRASVPLERELADEVPDLARDQQATRFHLERRTGRMLRVVLAE